MGILSVCSLRSRHQYLVFDKTRVLIFCDFRIQFIEDSVGPRPDSQRLKLETRNVPSPPSYFFPPASTTNRPLVEDAESVELMVAMIDVPPKHVPDGF
jgi:hypothetical protein